MTIPKDYKYVRLICILMLLSLFSVEIALAGNTHFISPHGNDTTGTGTIENPYLTIQVGVTKAVAGDTVIVRDGVYTDTDYDGLIINLDNKHGTSNNWITIKAENQYGAVLDGQLENYTHVTDWTQCTNATCGTGSATDIYWATVPHQVNYVRHGKICATAEDCLSGGLDGSPIRKNSVGELVSTHNFYYDVATQRLYYKYSAMNKRYFIASEGVSHVIRGSGASYIRIEGFEIKRALSGGMGFWSSDNIYVYRNKIHDMARITMPCDQPSRGLGAGGGVGTNAQSPYFTIDSNIFYNLGRLPGGCEQSDYNRDHALYLIGDKVNIVNNLFYNVKSGWPIQLAGYADPELNPNGLTGANIINNTFYGKNPRRDGHINSHQQVHDLVIENNISHTPGAYFVENGNNYAYAGRDSSNNPPRNIVRNNLVYGGAIANYVTEALYTIFSNNTIGQDPLFVNLIKYDFHLKSGSPAIDAGLNAGLGVDIEGNPRVGTPDMGAYEYTGTSVEPPITDKMPPSSPITLRTVAAPSSILSNSGFELGTSPWVFYTNGAGTFNVDAAGNGNAQAGHVVVTTAGTNVQLYQADVVLEPNTLYQLSFKAYSNTGHDVRVALHKHGSPYTSYGLSQAIDLTASWQEYSLQFTTSGFTTEVNDGRLVFLLSTYNASGDEYFFDDVVLTKLGAAN